MKNLIKENKLTLKKVIVKKLRWSIFLSNLIFSIILIVTMATVIKQGAIFYSRFMSKSISEEINSSFFLKEMHINSIDELVNSTPELMKWRMNLDKKLSIGSYTDPKLIRDIDHEGEHNYYIMDVVVLINNETIYHNLNGSGPQGDYSADMEKYKKLGEQRLDFQEKMFLWFDKHYNTSVSYDIKDDAGKVVGYTVSKLNPQVIIMVLGVFALIVLIVIFVNLIAVYFISSLFSTPIIMPIKKLIVKVKAVANGNVEDALNVPIDVKIPLKEIEELTGYTNKIIMKIKDYTLTLETQNEELEAMTTDQMETNSALEEKNNHLKNIMDNVGQGILTFGEDLIIYEECSIQCNKVFDKNPGGRKLSELLYEEAEEQEFMNVLLTKIANEEDDDKIELYIQLLPEEVKIKNRNVSLKYKVVKNIKAEHSRAIMVILTDITEKRRLEKKMQKEQGILKMVVKAVVNINDFLSCIEEYEKFSNYGINNILESNESLNDIVIEIFRNVHNFKGNFSQYDVNNVVSKLHEMENYLSTLKEENIKIDKEELKNNIKEYDMLNWIQEDTDILKTYLGEDFFNKKDLITVDKSILINVEKKMLNLLPYDEFMLLLPYVRSLRYKSFKELLASYPGYVEKLAERLQKDVAPIVIDGDDILVDQEYYRDFTKSLVHVFRNCMDHGIETAEERVLSGKSEIGTIKCEVKGDESNIIVRISDDGRGMDIEKIRHKVIKNGIIGENEAYNLSDEEILSVIFVQEFSLSEEVTDISGRGIGLYSVNEEIKKLNGSIEVKNNPGKGAEFIFTVPIQKINYVEKVCASEIIKPISEKGKEFVGELAKIKFDKECKLLNLDKINLEKYSALISIRGALQGIMIISYNKELAYMLSKHFILDDIDENEIEQYMEDVVAECSNIIIGNSIKGFGEIQDLITIGSPTIICYKGASIKYNNASITSCNFKNEKYEMSFSFVSMDEKIQEVQFNG